MDGQLRIPRGIHETALYAAQASQLGLTIRDLDDRLRDLMFVIARVPDSFAQVNATGIYVARHVGDPALRIWFSFNDEEIELLAVESYERHG